MYGTKNRLGRVVLCLAVGLGSAAPALAQEFQPYPSPKVTVEQYVSLCQAGPGQPRGNRGDPEGHESRRVLGHAHADVLHLHDQGPSGPSRVDHAPDGRRRRPGPRARRSATSRARKRNSPSCSATTRNGTCSSRKRWSDAISNVGRRLRRLQALSYTASPAASLDSDPGPCANTRMPETAPDRHQLDETSRRVRHAGS